MKVSGSEVVFFIYKFHVEVEAWGPILLVTLEGGGPLFLVPPKLREPVVLVAPKLQRARTCHPGTCFNRSFILRLILLHPNPSMFLLGSRIMTIHILIKTALKQLDSLRPLGRLKVFPASASS